MPRRGKSTFLGFAPPDDPIYTGGPDLVEWLENLSEKDRQRLIDHLMDACSAEEKWKQGRLH
jgi:hypothetical protein